MHFTLSALKATVIRWLCLGILGFVYGNGHAQHAGPDVDHISQNLPNLPETDASIAGRFRMDKQRFTVGYGTRDDKWGATVNQFLGATPSITFDYGRLLTDTLGAGGVVTQGGDHTEFLFNGVYAPWRDLRARLAGSQLRSYGVHPHGASSSVMQNSYLLDVRKTWTEGWLLSDAGMAAYSVAANGGMPAHRPAMFGLDDHDAYPEELAVGRQDGYMLNLGLQPTDRSRLELRHEAGSLAYSVADAVRSEESLAVNRIKYSHQLGNCVRVQGRYSASAGSDRVDFNVARRSWNVNLSRATDGGDTAIRLGYAIPLGGPSVRSECIREPESTARFDPIIDATMKRPVQFPREPLARIESVTPAAPTSY
jgi:hypothetical protein